MGGCIVAMIAAEAAGAGETGGAAARYFGGGRAAGSAESASAKSAASKTEQTARKGEQGGEKVIGKAEKATGKAEKAVGKFQVPDIVSRASGSAGYPGLKAEYVASILLLVIWPVADRSAINTKAKFANWARQLVAITLAHAILIAIAATGPRAKRLATLFGFLLLLGLAMSKKGSAGVMLGPQVLRSLVKILSPRGKSGTTGTVPSNTTIDYASMGNENSTSSGGGGGGNSASTGASRNSVARQRAARSGTNNKASITRTNRGPARAATRNRGGSILPDITGGQGKAFTPKHPGAGYTKGGNVRAPVVAPPRQAPAPPRKVPTPRPGPPPHP